MQLDFTGQAQAQQIPYVSGGISGLIGTILSAVMVIALLIALSFLLWGGIDWILAGGEKAKLDSARGKITGAVVGLFVLSGSLAFFMLLQSFLGIKIFTFSSGDNPTHLQPDPAPICNAAERTACTSGTGFGAGGVWDEATCTCH